ncbi:MAG: hypothetical protein AABY07_00245 [Nanoarchaeota archaeon]
MADITNQLIIRTCNEKIRPTAEELVSAYDHCIRLKNWWDANNIGGACPNTADNIADGSGPTGDGRPQMTGRKANHARNFIDPFLIFMDTVEVGDTQSRITRLRQIAVNTEMRF